MKICIQLEVKKTANPKKKSKNAKQSKKNLKDQRGQKIPKSEDFFFESPKRMKIEVNVRDCDETYI